MRSIPNTVGWALLAAFVVASALIGDLESAPRNVRLFQLAYLTGFVGYGLIVWPLVSGRHRIDNSWSWLTGAVVMRLALMGTVPNDDAYRYLWEGRVQQAGFNPYVHSPAASELANLRDADWGGINHPEYTAIYGPLAQIEFRLVAAAWPSIWAFNLVHVLLDGVTVVLLALWCRSAGSGPGFAKLYGLCPLVLTAFAIAGHVDSLMLVPIAGAGLLTSRGSLKWAGVLLGAAVAVKVVAVVFWPWLFVRDRRSGLLAVATAVGLYLPYSDAGTAVFDSLLRFAGHTAFFGPIHAFLSAWIGSMESLLVSLGVLAVIIGLLLYRRWDFEAYGLAVFAAMVLLMPVVHYWYLAWILLYVPFRPGVAWLVLAMSMVAYFEVPYTRAMTGEWAMPTWAFLAAYLPFVIVWAATIRYADERGHGS